jgi:phosphonate transport system substrate-binding protein
LRAKRLQRHHKLFWIACFSGYNKRALNGLILGLGDKKMKYVIAVLLSLMVSKSWAKPREITIGMIPGNGVEMQKKAEELAQVLQEKLKVDVNIYIPKKYENLISAMKNKKVDFAFYTAMSFVYAEKEANAKVLLKSVWDQPYYYSTIVTKPDSKIKSIKDLKGKKIGFVDEKSTSGYLLPMLELQKQGIQKTDLNIVYTQNHKSSVEMLEKGEVDAIAVFCNDSSGKKGAWETYFPDRKIKVKNLWVSVSLPTDPFTVRKDFFEANTDFSYDVMMTFLELPGLYKDRNILKDTIGVTKMVTANSSQYDSIRKLIQNVQ